MQLVVITPCQTWFGIDDTIERRWGPKIKAHGIYRAGRGLRHKKLTVWARQMIGQPRRWFPGRKLVVAGDSSLMAIELPAATPGHVTMFTRLRLDATLYVPVPPRRPGQPGRPRKKGKRLPKLEAVLVDVRTKWQEVEATWWYGRRAKRRDADWHRRVVSTRSCHR